MPYQLSNYDIPPKCQMSGLPREAPCTGNITIYCDQTTDEILSRLRTQSLIFPPFTRPSYRCVLVLYLTKELTLSKVVEDVSKLELEHIIMTQLLKRGSESTNAIYMYNYPVWRFVWQARRVLVQNPT